MSSAAKSACTSEYVITKSGFNAAISCSRAVLKPLTRGLSEATGGMVKNAVTPTTFSHAPIRHSQSAASADKQTMRCGVMLMLNQCPPTTV